MATIMPRVRHGMSKGLCMRSKTALRNFQLDNKGSISLYDNAACFSNRVAVLDSFKLLGAPIDAPIPILYPRDVFFLHDRQSSKDARQVLRELQQKPIGLRPAEIKEVEHDEKGETTEACILYYPPDRDPNPILETGLEIGNLEICCWSWLKNGCTSWNFCGEGVPKHVLLFKGWTIVDGRNPKQPPGM